MFICKFKLISIKITFHKATRSFRFINKVKAISNKIRISEVISNKFICEIKSQLS